MTARGELWWVDFGPPQGSTAAFRRPALIISADTFNRSRIATVQVAAITSNVRRAAMPGGVFLSKGTGGLRRDSVVVAHQVATIDRAALARRLGVMPGSLMNQVNDALRLALDL